MAKKITKCLLTSQGSGNIKMFQADTVPTFMTVEEKQIF